MSTLTNEDVADAIGAIEATYRRPDANGVCTLDGFGAKLTIERGALVAHDGIGPHRRTRKYEKATHGLARVVLANPEGFVTFEALRWCASLGIGLVLVDNDGRPIFANAPRIGDDARLRRAQGSALAGPVGLGIARYLLGAKLAGQAQLLARFESTGTASGDGNSVAEARASISELAYALGTAQDIEQCRQLEASAAALYFNEWVARHETSPRFATKDRGRVPAHWLIYEGRRSVLASASANRKAERPLNALLNYAFALLEAEAIFACNAVGLDPGLGIVHADAKGRASMALDLLEPVRPAVEGDMLDMVSTRTFRKAEFTEAPDGAVRLRAPLTHELAELMPRWAALLGPVAETVAHMLGSSIAGKFVATTPLTGSKLRAAQAVVKARKAEASARVGRNVPKQAAPAPMAPLPLWACPECGVKLDDPRRVLCDDCARTKGHTPAVRQSRGRAIAARKALLKASAEGLGFPADKDWYRANVLPRLAGHKLSKIMECGISKGYASYIRSGKYVPHVSTWPALARLTGAVLPEPVLLEAAQ